MTTSTATSVVFVDELPEAVLLPDVEGVSGADGRDLLAEDLSLQLQQHLQHQEGEQCRKACQAKRQKLLLKSLFRGSQQVSSFFFLR